MQRIDGPAREAFSLLLDAAPDAMVVVDHLGSIVMANTQAAHLFGFADGELVGQPVEMLVPQRYRESHLAHRTGYFRTPGVRPMGAGLELFGLRKDGSEFPVEISLSPVETDIGSLAVSAIRDISDRKRADQERVKLAREQAARAEAEQANRLKDEFLAMLAHELRNPLAAINTALAVMNRIGGQDAATASTRTVMARQVRQLSRMVDDLLDVARVTSGKIALHRETVDVSELITRCVSALTDRRGVQHEIRVQARPVKADADPIRLEQIVTNLLTNAVKYTPEGGTISISAGAAGSEVVITVEDTGVGMTPDLVHRIFELFVQGERSPARSEGGLGIGLTLVKRLTELHGGSIEAASEGPNRGSRFTLRIPAAVDTEPSRPETITVAPGARSGRRILVVEDNADVREMLRTFLELDGHEVAEAADGVTGLETAIDFRPDVAFIDIGLPRMDGCQLAEELARHFADTPNRPALVALTGYGRLEDRHRIEAAGFAAHLVKPVDEARISEIVAALSPPPRRASP